MIANIEAERHRRVNLRVVDLLGYALMEANMVLSDGIKVERHGIKGVVRV